MVSERRIQKINELIKQELGKIFLKDLSFEKGVMVTITKVDASANLISAVVKISVMPESKAEKILSYLNQNIFDIQQKLNTKLNMRPVPKISFKIDLTEAKVQRVKELIERVSKEINFQTNEKFDKK